MEHKREPYPELPRHEVEALGVRTSYITAGDRDSPLVVLIHGMSASADVYRETMHELADDFWTVAPDLPGFGFSDSTEPFNLTHLVEWLAAFRHALRLPPMSLVAHSFGGALAARYTIAYPEDVVRLLLVAPAIKAGELVPDLLKRAALALGLVDLGQTVSESVPYSVEQAARSIHDPSGIEESVWARRIRDHELSRANGGVLKALAFEDMEDSLALVEQPTLILWGADDPVLPVSHASSIAAAVPQSKVIVWDQCGHIPFLEMQAEFWRVARTFLAGKEFAQ